MVNMNALAAGEVARRIAWEIRRGIRRAFVKFGFIGPVFVLCLLVAICAGISALRQSKALERMKRSDLVHRSQQQARLAILDTPNVDTPATRLQAFDAYLLPHGDIPDVIKNLFSLAEDAHLSLAQGEYKAQADAQGHFMRYGMALPVRGDAQAIHAFILMALNKHRSLALESIQFKRERIESREVEAHIQWVLFTRLPDGFADDPAPLKPSAPERNL